MKKLGSIIHLDMCYKWLYGIEQKLKKIWLSQFVLPWVKEFVLNLKTKWHND